MSDREFDSYILLSYYTVARCCFAADVSVPTIQNLLQELKGFNDWYMFGTFLNVPVKELQKIESSRRGELDRCKIDTLQYWLDNNVNASWKDVIRALEQTDQLVLASTLKHKYLLPTTVNEEDGE